MIFNGNDYAPEDTCKGCDLEGLSDCCNAPIKWSDICTDCGEHCGSCCDDCDRDMADNAGEEIYELTKNENGKNTLEKSI